MSDVCQSLSRLANLSDKCKMVCPLLFCSRKLWKTAQGLSEEVQCIQGAILKSTSWLLCSTFSGRRKFLFLNFKLAALVPHQLLAFIVLLCPSQDCCNSDVQVACIRCSHRAACSSMMFSTTNVNTFWRSVYNLLCRLARQLDARVSKWLIWLKSPWFQLCIVDMPICK